MSYGHANACVFVYNSGVKLCNFLIIFYMVKKLLICAALTLVLSLLYSEYYTTDDNSIMAVDLAKIGKIVLKSVSTGEVSICSNFQTL